MKSEKYGKKATRNKKTNHWYFMVHVSRLVSPSLKLPLCAQVCTLFSSLFVLFGYLNSPLVLLEEKTLK